MYIKFSKSLKDIIKIKDTFFIENNKLLNQNRKLMKFFIKLPRRTKCKNCEKKINRKIDFISHGMGYIICKNCSHLNSEKNDNSTFHKYYTTNSNYIKIYEKHFKERVKNIYEPKLDFIINYLKRKTDKIRILDLGSGAGHFLKACENKHISSVGYETNPTMVKEGNKFLKKKNLIKIKEFKEALTLIENNKTENVLSLISVLEHVEHPNQILKSFCKSKIKYLFLSIPLFNFSVYIETIFQNIYPRQLPVTHPHLYTYKSILYTLKKYRLKVCGEWWFGTEMLDLYKTFRLNLEADKQSSKKFNNYFSKLYLEEMNKLQSIFDKNKKSSEVHLIIKK